MTVETTDNRISHAGNGITTDFSFPYLFFVNSDLEVLEVDDVTAVETIKVLDTDYTVTGSGADAGGTVTATTAPATGKTWVIIRELDGTQGLDLVENDSLPAEEVERAFDRTTMLTQQNATNIARALRFPDGYTGGASLIMPAPTALKTFRWNVTADALEETDDPAISAVDAAASAAAAAASETAAAASAGAASSDAAATAEDAVATAADRVQTGLDATSSAGSASSAAASALAADVAKIEWQGAWSGATTYNISDAVEDGGTSYICTADHTNQQPPNASFWDVLAEKGVDGAGSGTVTSIVTGIGLTGGPIVTTGTISADIASQAQAEAGIDTTTLMTPERSAQAIAALGGGGVTLGVTVAASGTSVDFTGVSANAKVIVVSFDGISETGSSRIIVQLGDSGGVETSGYVGALSILQGGTTVSNTLSTGFEIDNGGGSGKAFYGAMILTLMDAATNTWSCSSVTGRTDTAQSNMTGGTKSLTATLDQVRITTSGGTNTFDAGNLNIAVME